MTPDIEYLLSLEAVRERAQIVFAAAQKDDLSHFTYHADKLPEAAAYVTSVINVSYCYLQSDSLFSLTPDVSFSHTRTIDLTGAVEVTSTNNHNSETLAPTTSKPSLPMAAGNTSTSAASHVSTI